MLRSLDHLIIAVPRLDAAIAAYRTLGFTVTPGGEHPGQGTHNALIAFADGTYFELLAFHADNPAHRWWPLWKASVGLLDVCAATDDLAGDVARMRAAGIEMSEPMQRHRLRDDGQRVEWEASATRGDAARVVPFVLRDVTPRSVRVPGAHAHDNGVSGIDTLVIAVRDLDLAARRYRAVLGQPGVDVTLREIGARGSQFTLGPHTLQVVGPDTPGSPLTAWLAAFAGGPYAATLSTRGPAIVLDAAATYGTRLRLAGA